MPKTPDGSVQPPGTELTYSATILVTTQGGRGVCESWIPWGGLRVVCEPWTPFKQARSRCESTKDEDLSTMERSDLRRRKPVWSLKLGSTWSDGVIAEQPGCRATVLHNSGPQWPLRQSSQAVVPLSYTTGVPKWPLRDCSGEMS